MLDTILLLLAGAFIGWHYPQPSWAKWMQAKIMGFFKKDETEE